MAEQSMNERLYTLREAAEVLKISVATVRRMIQNKQLEAVKVGGQFRIKRASLVQYL